MFKMIMKLKIINQLLLMVLINRSYMDDLNLFNTFQFNGS